MAPPKRARVKNEKGGGWEGLSLRPTYPWKLLKKRLKKRFLRSTCFAPPKPQVDLKTRFWGGDQKCVLRSTFWFWAVALPTRGFSLFFLLVLCILGRSYFYRFVFFVFLGVVLGFVFLIGRFRVMWGHSNLTLPFLLCCFGLVCFVFLFLLVGVLFVVGPTQQAKPTEKRNDKTRGEQQTKHPCLGAFRGTGLAEERADKKGQETKINPLIFLSFPSFLLYLSFSSSPPHFLFRIFSFSFFFLFLSSFFSVLALSSPSLSFFSLLAFFCCFEST